MSFPFLSSCGTEVVGGGFGGGLWDDVSRLMVGTFMFGSGFLLHIPLPLTFELWGMLSLPSAAHRHCVQPGRPWLPSGHWS